MAVIIVSTSPSSQVLKFCDGAIAHVSTIVGGNWAVGDADGRGDAEGAPGGAHREGTRYIVMAGQDGAVRFFDLKFRVEVRVLQHFLNDLSDTDIDGDFEESKELPCDSHSMLATPHRRKVSNHNVCAQSDKTCKCLPPTKSECTSAGNLAW